MRDILVIVNLLGGFSAAAGIVGVIWVIRNNIRNHRAQKNFAKALQNSTKGELLLDYLGRMKVASDMHALKLLREQFAVEAQSVLRNLPAAERNLVAQGLFQPSIRGQEDYLLKACSGMKGVDVDPLPMQDSTESNPVEGPVGEQLGLMPAEWPAKNNYGTEKERISDLSECVPMKPTYL